LSPKHELGPENHFRIWACVVSRLEHLASKAFSANKTSACTSP